MTFHNDSRVHRHDKNHVTERDSIVAVATDTALASESNASADSSEKSQNEIPNSLLFVYKIILIDFLMSYVMTNANVSCIDAKTIIIAWPYTTMQSRTMCRSRLNRFEIVFIRTWNIDDRRDFN